ncbi:transcriptional regulator [Rhodobacteraceae bacterium CCMM004]|nr:transcriptional regulator [Rhodobacteraceae bacterium CCMM004]
MEDKTTCPVATAIRVVGGKWKPGILWRLRDDTMRYGALRREMPWVSERVLIAMLKELVADGVVQRTDHREVPPRVDYALTDYGRSVLPVMEAMAAWGQGHLDRQAAGGSH